jgi:hypothetical protein
MLKHAIHMCTFDKLDLHCNEDFGGDKLTLAIKKKKVKLSL